MKKILILAAALLCFSGAADAKWWIFGKTGGEVGIKYLYINKIPADEAGSKIKIFRETLGADGLIRISGRASVGKSAVGSVRISLDDKATWQDVKFAENGAFEFSFKPEPDRTYQLLLEITDTAGKTNKVDETRKELSLSGENIQAKVRETLDALFDAYNRENLARFMAGVGENFAGDKAILERAVKRDFDALSSINMRYTVNNVAAGAQGRVFVSITFNRMVLVNKTGATNTDTGFTEFVFDSAEGKLALYSMKQPLMFGLSDADNVATGVVQGNTAEALTLDDSGSLGGTKIVAWSGDGHFGYNFETDEVEDCDGTAGNCTGQIFFMIVPLYIGADDSPATALIGEISGKNISSVTTADIQSAATQPQAWGMAAGKTYGLKYNSDYYAVEIVSISGSGPYNMSFKARSF